MLDAFVADLQELDDTASLEQTMARQVADLGFERFAYVALRVPDSNNIPFTLTNYPYEWAQRYEENDYVNDDPVFHRATGSIEPFNWPSLRERKRLTAKQRQIFDEAGSFGLYHGAAIPVHGPRGAFALLSLNTDQREPEFQKVWRVNKLQLHMMALYYHSAIEKKLLLSAPRPQFHFTDREREALLWTARGKTSWETSEIMRISQETVNFHLKNAMHKIGVYSKHHAVVKAIMIGAIFP